MGVENKTYKLQELVRTPVVFCATGVTSGPLLSGIKKQLKGWRQKAFISAL